MRIHQVPEEVKRLMMKAFPHYKGRKFEVVVADPDQRFSLESYWSEGSRDWWAVLRLADGEVLPVPENGTPYKPGLFPHGREPKLVPGFAFVRRRVFCGKEMGLTMYVHPDNVVPLLPAGEPVSWAERVVLYATRSLKSRYAGEKDYRFHEAQRQTGISREEWHEAVKSLKEKGMLNKAGAITPKGKDAISGVMSWPKREQEEVWI